MLAEVAQRFAKKIMALLVNFLYQDPIKDIKQRVNTGGKSLRSIAQPLRTLREKNAVEKFSRNARGGSAKIRKGKLWLC